MISGPDRRGNSDDVGIIFLIAPSMYVFNEKQEKLSLNYRQYPFLSGVMDLYLFSLLLTASSLPA